MSEMKIPVTAVFDIGKTNKKFLLFDRDYHIVYSTQITISQVMDDDGYPSEDLPGLKSWICQELSSAVARPEFTVSHLNFSGYGASLVHLNAGKAVVGYLYDYMKPCPEDVQTEFYGSYGGKEKFALETASPPMGMLNSGLQLYWIKKKKPDLFSRIQYSLHFPQYLSYLFTGEAVAELTSIGCHTAMWNFQTGGYHHWLENEGIRKLFPGIEPVQRLKPIAREGVNILAGPGIHDSSAALVPYLKAMDGPFLLISTGTWSITFNPFSGEQLTFDELQRDCLCYINIYGRQVKAARLFLGNEYRHQKEKLIRHFDINKSDEEVQLDTRLLEKLIQATDPGKKLKLETALHSGPCPTGKPAEWDLRKFASYREAYHQLMLDLVILQEQCILLAEGSDTMDKVIVTGGFAQNNFFLNLLAARLHDKRIFTAAMPHATALGTALVTGSRHNNGPVNLRKLLDLKHHTGMEISGISRYSWSGESLA